MLTKLRNNMKHGFTLIELMIVVAILAILAVVAVPAFIKYMRRSKTSEAVKMLEKIAEGANNYYADPRVQQGTGTKIECQFPGSTTMEPTDVNLCCGGSNDADADDRCDATSGNWDSAEWSALTFEMRDQHYFQYQFESAGTLTAAAYTAKAHADLDCDSTFSTFERYGYGDLSASRSECSARSSAALYKENETE